MSFISRADLPAVRAIAELNYTNPFTSRRIELEHISLGSHFEPEEQPYWSHTESHTPQRRQNVIQVTEKAKALLKPLREQLHAGAKPETWQLELYEDLAYYVLFYELLGDWEQPSGSQNSTRSPTPEIWKRFSRQFDFWLRTPDNRLGTAHQKSHLFSMFHQIYRAFFNIFHCVIGQSLPAADLRSKIWESIFTVNMRRYRDHLYRTLNQVTTLITGPSGSGKELVARAIGLSGYIPLDTSSGQFRTDFTASFSAINISAFSSNLVESELFGHAKGAFTGAIAARSGWLESCGPFGSILLDEIGELELTTQVKLLRVLQNREFQRIGESKTRRFEGKLIAATNRNLRAEIEKKSFREDLYYRLCSDVIETPTLDAQLQDNPGVLANLVGFIVQRIAPDVKIELTTEIVNWLHEHLPVGYSWPGNIRELEQCVRNLMIHGSYRFDSQSTPTHASSKQSARMSQRSEIVKLADQIAELSLTADELVAAYCRIAYRQTRSFEKAAKRLQLDRRTVRRKSDQSNANEC